MRRVFAYLGLTVLAVAIGTAAFAGGASVASAQELPENVTYSASNDSTVQFQLDDDVRVLDVNYSTYDDRQAGDLEVEVENTGSTSETVYVITVGEVGSQTWGWAQPRIQAGETTTIVVENVPDKNGDVAAMIATQTGLENQNAQWLRTGERQRLFNGPATWGYVYFSGAAMFLGSAGGIRWWIKKQRGGNDDEPVIRRRS